MDKYLRLFIKYQAYTIVMFTFCMVIFFTPIMADHEANEIENLRFGGVIALIFGLSWAIAVLCLVIAIQKEKKQFLYPFMIVFGLDLFLMILREFYVMIIDRIFIEVISLKFFIASITVPYVCGSLFALHRLFTVDPIEVQRSEGFVRFDRNGIEENEPNATSSPVNHVQTL